jgi:hypothetical protein
MGTATLDGGEWPASRFGRFTPGEDPLYPLEEWVDRRAGLVAIAKRKYTLFSPAGSRTTIVRSVA